MEQRPSTTVMTLSRDQAEGVAKEGARKPQEEMMHQAGHKGLTEFSTSGSEL